MFCLPMKKSLCMLTAILTLTGTAQPAGALGNKLLSPGLEHLASSCDMIRTGLFSTEIGFTREDFANALGSIPDTVTITSLPPAVEGTLYFGTMPAAVGQKISGVNLSLLRFVPTAACTGSSFRFRGYGEYTHNCTLRFTQTVNQAPRQDASASVPVWTQQNITVFGKLPGYDPDGDSLRFEIVSPPVKGLVVLSDPKAGTYRYTPYADAGGADVFTYQFRDSYGNYSPVCTVEVDIDEAACEIVFADMTDHWAQNAAVVMAADNIMEVFSAGGEVFFHPDTAITREEYLVTVMKALGADDVAPCATVFADEEEMNPDYTGYIHRAYTHGIIRGSEENGKTVFRPADCITRAEAAVILNAILGADMPEVLPVFADSSAVPVWAGPSLYALTELGILQGTGDGYLSPDSILNRGQTAQILLSVKKLFLE